MVDDEDRKAMEWLTRTGRYGKWVPFTDDSAAERATLKRLLAEPRLPKVPDIATLEAMGSPQARAIYDDLYAHLTAPKTKEIEVWHVECAWASHGEWKPALYGPYHSKQIAEAHIEGWTREGVTQDLQCIRVTGPHKQTVPA